MASVYTNDLRLEEIGSGEQSGTWGDTTNTNLELIAEAFSFGTEAITTNADTHTTTIADGSTDPGRSIYLKYTGTLDSACTITLGPNTVSKVWFIENATSGSQNIIISQGSGANVTIGNGAVKMVYSDGAGSGAAVVDALVDLDLTGTTTIAAANISGDLDVDGTANLDVVDIDGAVDMASTLQVDGAITSSSGATITTADNNPQLTLTSTDTDSGHGPRMNLVRNPGEAGADGDNLGQIFIQGYNDAGTPELIDYFQLFTEIEDASDGTEDARQIHYVMTGGSQRSRIEHTGSETVINEDSRDVNFRVETDNTVFGLFVDAGNDHVCINTGTDYGGVLNVETTGNGDTVTLACTDTDSSAGPVLVLKRAVTGSSADFLGRIRFDGQDNAGNNTTYTRIDGKIIDATNGSEDGALLIHSLTGGSERERVRITQTETVLNEDSHDLNFRVESDGNANAIFVDAGNNEVILNGSSNGAAGSTTFASSTGNFRNVTPNATTADHLIGAISGVSNGFQIANDTSNNQDYKFFNGTGNSFQVGSSETVVNESGNDRNFRVESDGNFNMFFVDAGNNHVNIGTSGDHGGLLNIESGDNDATLVLACSDTDANVGPDLKLDRIVTGADNDFLGRIDFRGGDNAGNLTQYCQIETEIRAADNGSEAGRLNFRVVSKDMTSGAPTKYQSMIGKTGFGGAETCFNEDSNDIDFRVEGDTNTNMIFADAGDSDKVYVGKNSSDFGTVGIKLRSDGALELTRSGGQPMFINRLASDGNLIEFYQASNLEGSISVSGSTVSYNGFSGLHESSGIADNIAIGTVCSTIDELDVYPNTTIDTEGNTITHKKAGQTRADHAKIKVSDTEGDKRVYGVLQRYDDNGKPLVASVGIGSVRVTGACEGGDLLESNGDGTAKVQSDDIIRSKTIGKVTIGNSSAGVKLVSCVLYCG